jgi:hypothetical protein
MSGNKIKLTDSERQLASRIGLEMHGQLTDMATSIMNSISIEIPKDQVDHVKLKRVVMNVAVFSVIDGVEEELCSTGLVTIEN